METEDLKVICDMTVRLTEMRQAKCEHLCIENFAPECLEKLLTAVIEATVPRCTIDPIPVVEEE